MESIGKRVCDILEEKGLTKEDLEERLGRSARTVRRYTSESKTPGKCAIRQLSAALEVEPDVLLMKEQDYKRYKNGEDVEIVKTASHTPETHTDDRKPEVMIFLFGGIVYGYRDEK